MRVTRRGECSGLFNEKNEDMAAPRYVEEKRIARPEVSGRVQTEPGQRLSLAMGKGNKKRKRSGGGGTREELRTERSCSQKD